MRRLQQPGVCCTRSPGKLRGTNWAACDAPAGRCADTTGRGVGQRRVCHPSLTHGDAQLSVASAELRSAPVVIAHDWDRLAGRQVELPQQSKALVFQ